MHFEQALQHVLRSEGGLVNNPRDPGKITKFGISLRAYPELGEDGIRNLTVAQASAIYKRDYWDKMECSRLPDGLRLMTFDCAVNQGVGFASKALQGSVGARADGRLGPQTLASAASADLNRAILKFAMLRFVRYLRNDEWRTFGEGWMSRLFSVILSTKE